jgi:hypothetical protein
MFPSIDKLVWIYVTFFSDQLCQSEGYHKDSMLVYMEVDHPKSMFASIQKSMHSVDSKSLQSSLLNSRLC